MDGIKRHRTASAELDFSENTKRFLSELFGESIGSPSAATKLDAIIEMQRGQAGVPAAIELLKEEVSIMHQLLVELGAEPEKIEAIRARIRTQVQALESAKQNTK